jgi:outer membrane protein OmpA-like peptidoglycan-associated protein
VDVYRTGLAAISLVCGLILLIVAGRRYVLKKSVRASLMPSFYGLLFVVCALLLWQSRFGPLTRPVESIQKPATPQTEKLETMRVTEIPAASSSDSTTRSSVPQLEEKAVLPSDLSPTGIPVEPEHPAVQRRKINTKTAAGDSASAQYLFEDRAYAFISRTFDAVERWFMRNGSPAPVQRQHAETAAIEFRHVAFHFGTAELQAESRDVLLRYAKYLRSHSEPSLIEIQVCSNEGGMEPFNYILTQARAEAVRDVLVENGVSTQRLVPVARGSQGTDSLGLSSHVRFVTRP